VVLGGQVTDIQTTANGGVLGLSIDGGRIVASTQDGQPVSPIVPVAQNQNIGPFSGCPECLGVIQQGGSIRGLVIENGLLRAVIGGFGPLPGEAWLAQFSPPPGQVSPTPDLTTPLGPYLRLTSSTLAIAQPAARPGDQVQAIGSGFCPTPNCSPVTLTLAGQILAADVAVDANGYFQTSFVWSGSAGQYLITASQLTAGNQLLTAVSPLFVPTAEVEEAPDLTISFNGNSLTVTWPIDATEYELEWTDNLSQPDSWVPFLGQIIPQGDSNIAFIQLTGSQAFFRLHRQ
jgi:hypothetical protein